MRYHHQEFYVTSQSILQSVWRGLLIGGISGSVVSLFRLTIAHLSDFVGGVYQQAASRPILLIPIIFGSVLAIIFAGYLLKSEPDIKGSGIPNVEGELLGLLRSSWWSILWKKFTAGSLTISMGLMLGREGPSIQLGAMAAKGLGKGLRLSPKELRTMIAAGAAAGLSAAFNAPIAALLFIVEEVYHHFSRLVWVTALVASLVANAISLNIFGMTPVLHLSNHLESFALVQYWLLIPVGILLGLLGYGYEWLVLRMGKIYDVVGTCLKLPRHFYGILAVLLTIPLGYVFPDLLGGGHHLILDLPKSHWLLGSVLLFFVLRFIWSMIAYGSGLPGGIFLPLLTLGALAGLSLGLVVEMLGLVIKSQLPVFIILGMAGYFGAVSKAPLTAMILVTEMVGNLQQLMTIGIVTLVAYLTMDIMGGEPVYEAMLSTLAPISRLQDAEPTMIDLPVTDNLVGKKVCDLPLPPDVLITTQVAHGLTSVVTGQTRLKSGATIYLVVNETDIHQVRQLLLAE